MFVEFARYDYITEAYVAQCALESAGFHCFIQNFEHGSVAPMYLPALGGMRLLIREDQYADGIAWLKTLRETAELDPKDALPHRPRGMWVQGIVMSTGGFMLGPIILGLCAFSPPSLLIGISLILAACAAIYVDAQLWVLAALFSIIALMVSHAKDEVTARQKKDSA